MAADLYALNPELAGWVAHVMCFIVPRQIVPLGNPVSRACDACESFGAVVKKLIKHTTCRRRLTNKCGATHEGKDGKTWSQTFLRGYIEQAFRRVCVRADLLHGLDNLPFLQRSDHRLTRTGKAEKSRVEKLEKTSKPTMVDSVAAPTVWSKEQMAAVWP